MDDRTVGKIDNFDIISAMRIFVLVIDGVFDLGLAAVLDTLGTAGELVQMVAEGTFPFEAGFADSVDAPRAPVSETRSSTQLPGGRSGGGGTRHGSSFTTTG